MLARIAIIALFASGCASSGASNGYDPVTFDDPDDPHATYDPVKYKEPVRVPLPVLAGIPRSLNPATAKLRLEISAPPGTRIGAVTEGEDGPVVQEIYADQPVADIMRGRMTAAAEAFGVRFTDDAAITLHVSLNIHEVQVRTSGEIRAMATGMIQLVNADREEMHRYAFGSSTGSIAGSPRLLFRQLDKAMSDWFIAFSDTLNTNLDLTLAIDPQAFGQDAERKVAVLDIKPLRDMDPDLAQVATNIVLQAISSVPKTTAIGRADIEAILAQEKQKDLAGCDDVTCFSDLGGMLGAGWIVHGSLAGMHNRAVLSLALVDVDNAKVLKRVSKDITGPVTMAKEVTFAVIELFRQF